MITERVFKAAPLALQLVELYYCGNNDDNNEDSNDCKAYNGGHDDYDGTHVSADTDENRTIAEQPSKAALALHAVGVNSCGSNGDDIEDNNDDNGHKADGTDDYDDNYDNGDKLAGQLLEAAAELQVVEVNSCGTNNANDNDSCKTDDQNRSNLGMMAMMMTMMRRTTKRMLTKQLLKAVLGLEMVG